MPPSTPTLLVSASAVPATTGVGVTVVVVVAGVAGVLATTVVVVVVGVVGVVATVVVAVAGTDVGVLAVGDVLATVGLAVLLPPPPQAARQATSKGTARR